MTPEMIAYLERLGGYAAVVEGLVLIWVVNRWLAALTQNQKWQEGCKACLISLLTQSMEQTKLQVSVTQQNSDALAKLGQDLGVVARLLALLQDNLDRRSREKTLR